MGQPQSNFLRLFNFIFFSLRYNQTMKLFQNIPKTVLILGAASLFTDISSEGIYSILPLFLTQVLGAGPLALGIIEGIAETTASLLKVFSGIWTDRAKRRKPLVLWGYGISSFLRPLIGLAQSWPAVLVLRFMDRVGKGIRSSPRDAMIADVTTSSNRGASFGLHSAMDNAGALVGPLLASALLSFTGIGLRDIILLSAIPSLIAWLTLLAIKEKKSAPKKIVKASHFMRDWGKLGAGFKLLLGILLIFTLGNSTDAFLLIRLHQLGIPLALVPLLWGLHSGVRMVSAFYGGKLSDRIGRKAVILSGWIFYALIYLSFALVAQTALVVAIFLAYGIFYGLCEPSEKAFVADLAPQALRGTAFGYYNLVVGLFALPASVLFGWVGQTWGYPAAFTVGACFAGLASALLFFVRPLYKPSR